MKRSIESPAGLKISDFEDKTLLIVDDDDPFRDRLARAMEKKGFQVNSSKTVEKSVPLHGFSCKTLVKWLPLHRFSSKTADKWLPLHGFNAKTIEIR